MSPSLQRKLGLFTTITVVAGSVIGSGIFKNPAAMAAQVGSPLLLLLVWIVAGFISMCGAVINAEIGAMLPLTGGQYMFFEKMYGKPFAFVYGWSAFAVINTAAVAAIAYVFAEYMQYFITLPRFSPETELSWRLHIPFVGSFFPLKQIGLKAMTLLLVIMLTWANAVSVKTGGRIQLVFSVAKIMALLLLVLTVFLSGKGSFQNLVHSEQPVQWTSWVTITGCIAAISGAFGAYDGWNNIGFIAGEVKDPARNIPRGLFIGLGICILLYVLTSEAYLYMLPVEQMMQSQLVATDAVQPILGVSGAGVIAVLVLVSTFGAVNGNILACARVTFAMAEQKNFFSWAGRVHPQHQTPSNALWLHGVWTGLFVITGSFDMLMELFVFVSWIYYFFAAAGIFILRKKMPDAERPYKAWGYPVIPALFMLFTLFYLVVTVQHDVQAYREGKAPVINAVLGLLIAVAGIPLYLYFRRKSKRENQVRGA